MGGWGQGPGGRSLAPLFLRLPLGPDVATIATYTTDVLAALNDPLAQFYTSSNLTTWINRARTDTAKASWCIRRLTPSSASVTAITPGSVGSGYTTATVTVSGPDAIGNGFVTATATANIVGGQITSYSIGNAGSGYVANPTITITGDGSGATATATLGAHMATAANQEIVPFSALTTAIQTASDGAGIQAVVAVLDVAVSQGALRPSLDFQPWAAFQAYFRAINQGTSWPAMWTQFGRDENGQVWFFPVPQGVYEIQADCICTPAAISGTQTIDLIPDNLYQAVVDRACYYAYRSAQRKDDANDMKESWKERCADAAQYAFPGRTPTFYDYES